MEWYWLYEWAVDAPEPAAGTERTDRSGEFPAQADAETWLGQEFQQLLESGIEAVTLREGNRDVYGPMSLRSS